MQQPVQMTNMPVQAEAGQVVFMNTQTVIEPKSYIGLALCALFLSLPFGIVSLTLSILSNHALDSGDLESARQRGKASCYVSVTGIVITILAVILAIVLTMVVFAHAASTVVSYTSY